MTFIINVFRLICRVGDPVRQFRSTVRERERGGGKRKEEEEERGGPTDSCVM